MNGKGQEKRKISVVYYHMISVSLSDWAAITRYRRLTGLNNKHLFLSSGG